MYVSFALSSPVLTAFVFTTTFLFARPARVVIGAPLSSVTDARRTSVETVVVLRLIVTDVPSVSPFALATSAGTVIVYEVLFASS